MPRYRLKKSYNDFKATIDELSSIASNLSNTPRTLERDVHIEGCFLRVVVTWENFLEEYFLRCMCSAQTCCGKVIRPQVPCSQNTQKAFKLLQGGDGGRNNNYADWLSHDILQRRVTLYFHHQSRIHKIYESPEKLYALTTIRNAIAHRSPFAIKKFKDYVIDHHGYLSQLDPSMAELLIMRKVSNNKLIFKDISDYYLGLAKELTK